MNKQTILRQTWITSLDYQNVKNLKAFNDNDYTWSEIRGLYLKMPQRNLKASKTNTEITRYQKLGEEYGFDSSTYRALAILRSEQD